MYNQASRRQRPGDGQVTFLDFPFCKHPVQSDFALLVLGEKDQPLGRQVEAVDRRRPVSQAHGDRNIAARRAAGNRYRCRAWAAPGTAPF